MIQPFLEHDCPDCGAACACGSEEECAHACDPGDFEPDENLLDDEELDEFLDEYKGEED